MLTKVTAKVTGVAEHSEYYPRTGKYTLSTLTIVDNPAGITGIVTVRESLEFVKFHSILVNTNLADNSCPITETELTKVF
jgi:hypothetical protein